MSADAQDEGHRLSHETRRALAAGLAFQRGGTVFIKYMETQASTARGKQLPHTGLGAAPLNSLPASWSVFRGGGIMNRKCVHDAESTEGTRTIAPLENEFPSASLPQASKEPPNGRTEYAQYAHRPNRKGQVRPSRCQASAALPPRPQDP